MVLEYSLNIFVILTLKMHIHWLYDKIDQLVNVEKKTDISNGMNMFWVLDGDLILWMDDSHLSGSRVLNVQLPIIQFQFWTYKYSMFIDDNHITPCIGLSYRSRKEITVDVITQWTKTSLCVSACSRTIIIYT